MAHYVTGFVLPQVGLVHAEFDKLIIRLERLNAIARRAGVPQPAPLLAAELAALHVEFNRELGSIGKRHAANAVVQMRKRLKETAKRPDSGVRPHLRDALSARPIVFGAAGGIATGAIGIADIDRLNKVVNPTGPQYGPFWFEQEEGSTKHLGRILRGYFFGAGYTDPQIPKAEFGGGRGKQPIFVPGRFGKLPLGGGIGPSGGAGGLGTIQHPIEARHFIRDGAHRAAAAWETEITALNVRMARRIDSILP